MNSNCLQSRCFGNGMIITIDGPAGAGKSTAARRLADELGFKFLDTGAMYRAVTWAVLEQGIDPADTSAVARLAASIELRLESDRVFVNGREVTREIREAAVTANISSVADNPQVRQELVAQQRRIAAAGNFVCEGRDQGTVAFPHATCKIFLTASASSRAQRRVDELRARGDPADFDQILAQQNERDRRDSIRPVGKLSKASDAIEVLTDDLSLDQVVARLKQIAESRIAAAHP